ncbi:TIGR04326 family surface carbohydrate biosynthesis protein [Polynucleobacter sp. Adler-ghost]|uniref:TIGR04326 family surface carbohydrate biosynthesis protein n=1 Tax=Polynucleobacter sp. Adler-ghost TaxID=2770234 RepID=UPI001BFECF7E|nr:TIGR04326 family surface carbohydrate biosynthesis protein [Polynucleobacter sp. Adler-ghost]QWE31058.1 hypothetical protein ICV89_01680 [Polynucleobacter sp. Adler-ghost]
MPLKECIWICDSKNIGYAAPNSSKILLDSYSTDKKILSLPEYIDQKSDSLRSRFLSEIHALGEMNIRGKKVQEHLQVSAGASYWWMSALAEKSPFKYDFIEDVIRVLAIMDLLVERKPNKVCILIEGKPNLVTSIKRACSTLGITIQIIGSTGLTPKFNAIVGIKKLPLAVQAIGIGLLEIYKKRGLGERGSIIRAAKNGGEILFLSYFIHLDFKSIEKGCFRSAQWNILPDIIESLGLNYNFFHHFLYSADVRSPASGNKYLDFLNGPHDKNGNHFFIDSFWCWSVQFNIWWEWIRLQFKTFHLLNIENLLQKKSLTLIIWPIIKDAWDDSLRGPLSMRNCKFQVIFSEILKNIPRQKIGIYIFEGQPWEKAFIYFWRKYGHGKLIGVSNSTMPFWHLYLYEDKRAYNSLGEFSYSLPYPDILAVNGLDGFNASLSAGIPLEKLAVVEALRYLDLPIKKRMPFKEKKNFNKKIKILILGGIIKEETVFILDLLSNLEPCIRLNIDLHIKLHPYCVFDMSKYALNDVSELNNSLSEIINEYDFVLAENSTSAAVDAILCGVPVFVVTKGNHLNLSPIFKGGAEIFIRDADSLVKVILNFINKKEYREVNNVSYCLDKKITKWVKLINDNV